MDNKDQNTQDREILTKLIYDRFKTMSLNKEQFSILINRSIASIDRDRKASRGCEFIQHEKNRVYYPIHAVVGYLLSTNIVYND